MESSDNGGVMASFANYYYFSLATCTLFVETILEKYLKASEDTANSICIGGRD